MRTVYSRASAIIDAKRTRVNVFNGDLETVECASFRNLNFLHETHAKVFEHDAIRGGEEGEDVGNKVLLILGQAFPMLHVVGQIDFFRCVYARLRIVSLTIHPHTLSYSSPRDSNSPARLNLPNSRNASRLASSSLLPRRDRIDILHAPVQKDASAFLYISQTALYLIGNIVKLRTFESPTHRQSFEKSPFALAPTALRIHPTARKTPRATLCDRATRPPPPPNHETNSTPFKYARFTVIHRARHRARRRNARTRHRASFQISNNRATTPRLASRVSSSSSTHRSLFSSSKGSAMVCGDISRVCFFFSRWALSLAASTAVRAEVAATDDERTTPRALV